MTIICPPIELSPREVVPQHFSHQNMIALYQASQYYAKSTGLLAWRTKVDTQPWAGHVFVVFFGPMNSIKELPSVADPYPLFLPAKAGAPAATYRPVGWCRTGALHNYLYDLLLYPEGMDRAGYMPSSSSQGVG